MTFTNKGREEVLNFLDATITHFALGTDGASESESATALGAEVFRKVVNDTTIDLVANTIDIECFVGSPEANGNFIEEIGLFDAGAGGNMFQIANVPVQEKVASLEWLLNIVIEVN